MKSKTSRPKCEYCHTKINPALIKDNDVIDQNNVYYMVDGDPERLSHLTCYLLVASSISYRIEGNQEKELQASQSMKKLGIT